MPAMKIATAALLLADCGLKIKARKHINETPEFCLVNALHSV